MSAEVKPAAQHAKSLTSVALLMDGNRRWARSRGLPVEEGWREGYEVCKKIAVACFDRDIKEVFGYGFSTENWHRPASEVSSLFALLEFGLTTDIPFFLQNGMRLRVIGDRDGLAPSIRRVIQNAEAATAEQTRGTIILCINYDGRQEIVAMVRDLLERKVAAADVTPELVRSTLWSGFADETQLMIRTSGVHRMSGFLTWATTYSEFYVTDKLWPDFTEEDLDTAVDWFNHQEKRRGR